MKILVVEDDRAINELICTVLEDNNYISVGAEDGEIACNKIEECRFDLILLDIMLPKYDGYEVLEYAKQEKIPVIFLTAKASVEERVKGLKLGAEDYISKPFAVPELLARVEVVLRRYHKLEETIHFDEFQIDVANRIVRKNSRDEIALSPREYELFLFLVQNVNQTLFREQIYERVWEKEYTGDTRTIDYHIRCLRKKLDLGERLKTVYMMGYRLEQNEI